MNNTTNTPIIDHLQKKKKYMIQLYYLMSGSFIFLFFSWLVVCITKGTFLFEYLILLVIPIGLYYMHKRINIIDDEILNLKD
ncbi:hypothetical protein HGP29_07070 [Flammeovirga sp. SR4]|uniref:2TM domain-containing protein n=1 Tax=Flammeovirga agarivorans TaxID=2726742 RepID=A0A7X8XV46_9BACT|nr:hypothetical protein [Flammeovirga sp. SubArs3]NLR90961.1 hypothetical protein [Flammeovirga agarivorans]